MVELEALRPLLAQEYVVLTPNRRLAHRIRRACRRELAPGGVGETPAVYALGEWLERLWSQWLAQAPEPEMVLSDSREQWLWQEVIREQAQGLSWLRPGAVAQQAATAYRQLILWQVDTRDPALRAELEEGADSAALLRWCDAFHQRLRDRGWLTPAERDGRLLAALRDGALILERPLACLAFDDLAPLHRCLLEQAPALRELNPPGRGEQVAVIAAADADAEIRRGCRWLRRRLEAEPAATVALVVPDLGARRGRVERLLAEEWEPDRFAVDAPRRPPLINISAGVALLDTPLVESALRLLELWRGPLNRAEVVALGQCPFSGQAFADVRAVEWIERLWDLGCAEFDPAQLRAGAQFVAERRGGWSLARQLLGVAELGRREGVGRLRAEPPQWRRLFETLLADWGWPARPLDSVEYQQAEAWGEALAEFAALDIATGPLSLEQALAALRQVLQRRVFQPRVEDGALHVLGLLEAPGLRFDAAWVCGMGAAQWPAPATPHPLLPRGLQRRLRMPHCDAARELAFSEHLSSNLLTLAAELRISYARERDGVEQTVSPLFADLPSVASPEEDSGALEAWVEAQSPTLQPLAPGAAPAVTVAERPGGGSGLLRDQANCPFSAFARHRLGAEPLTEAALGPTALDRGQLLHRALEFLWRKLGRHSVLAGLSPEQRRERVLEAVEVALDDWLGGRGWQGRERLRSLERERLSDLLEHWLQTVELPREPFSVVAVEQTRRARFGPLELRLRADRVDRLADGRDLILDYKSGRAQPQDWSGERPAEPQLPLYAVLAEAERPDSVAGIAFAQLNAERCELRGVGEVDYLDPAPGEDWSGCKRDWQQMLERLAADFVAGRAQVDPRQPPQSCRYCPLSPVCRYYHQGEPLAADLGEAL